MICRIPPLLGFVLLLSETPALAQQRNPDVWLAQTTVFFGGSTHNAEGQLPVTPMAAVRFDGSVKGYFWLGVEASWTAERDVLVPPDLREGSGGKSTPLDIVFTPLIVARLVNTPWSSGMYAVGRLGRVRDGGRPYTVIGGGLGFRRQLHSKEFLVAEVRLMQQLHARGRGRTHWEFTVGFVPRGLPW